MYTSARLHGTKLGSITDVAIIATSPVHITTPEEGGGGGARERERERERGGVTWESMIP